MKKHVLLVEDNRKLSRVMREYLMQHDYQVDCEYRGDKAVFRILHENYGAVILDLNLPGLNGLQVCRMVRKDFPGFIIMLTANTTDDEQITGLTYGADDYITKPVQPKLLLARLATLARRHKTASWPLQQLVFGQLSIDLQTRQTKLQNKMIELTPSEFDLLALLATNAGSCLSRDNIMYALRGVDHDGIDRTIDLRISYLRNKLKDNMKKPYRIQTLRGKGYVLQADAWDENN